MLISGIFVTFSGFFDNKNNNSYLRIDQDTIIFSLRHDFGGDCKTDCYRSIGTNSIISINGIELDSICTHLFVECPSGLRLKKGIKYKFIAKHFIKNYCTTKVDTCYKNKMFVLGKKLKL